MDTTSIGIVGLGYWGPNLLRNFSQIEGCNVKYGCDLDEKSINKLRLAYPRTTFTQNYQELLDDKELSAIAIATPVYTHFELAKKALEHGKHILIEKPMTSSVKECEELITLAEEKNLKILVDHTFLYTGAVRKIKELIDNNELGKIYYFDSERINLGLIQNDINVIWDLAPHDISIMNFIFQDQKPISVSATGTNHVHKKVEEMAHITIKYASGVVGHIHVSWLSPVKIRKTLIGGDKKMILYDSLSREEIKIYDKGVEINFDEVTPFKPAYRSGDIHIPKINETEALKEEAQHFVNCIRGEEEPFTTGKDGLEVVKILEASDKSLKEGKVIHL